MKYIRLFEQYESISEHLKYHIENNVSITDNIFRVGSESYYDLLKESRELFESGQLVELNENDAYLFENTDLGKFELFNGELVPLDLPLLNEAEYDGKEVELNKPTRSSGPKKYKVYVKNPKTGRVMIVHFGDVKGGLKAKVSDPEARKRFANRHNCKMKKDKTTPGYWACRANRYASLWGGKTYPGYW
jgi:hypothetical protein